MAIVTPRLVACIAATALVGAAVSYGVVLSGLPTVQSMRTPHLDELRGKHTTFPGESGFWISYPVKSDYLGRGGSDAGIYWMAREGFKIVRCSQGCTWKYCWGDKFSTIEGGNWHVDPHNYQMVGRIYLHYKPVPKGTPHSFVYENHSYIHDAATCAGDFRSIRT